MVKAREYQGRWNPKSQKPPIRIYNPKTKTYYLFRRRGTGTGGSIKGQYVLENNRTYGGKTEK